jgi:hypothetical protein
MQESEVKRKLLKHQHTGKQTASLEAHRTFRLAENTARKRKSNRTNNTISSLHQRMHQEKPKSQKVIKPNKDMPYRKGQIPT